MQNLDLLNPNKYQPEIIVRFRDRMNRDSLYIECDLWREEMPTGDLHQFMSDALSGIERILDGSIRKIKHLEPISVTKHG